MADDTETLEQEPDKSTPVTHLPTCECVSTLSTPLSPPLTRDQLLFRQSLQQVPLGASLPPLRSTCKNQAAALQRHRRAMSLANDKFVNCVMLSDNKSLNKTIPWSYKLHQNPVDMAKSEVVPIQSEPAAKIVTGPQRKKDPRVVGPIVAWFRRTFPSLFVEQEVPEEERILAKALSVSIRDLESALSPLKQLDLLHVKHDPYVPDKTSQVESHSDWPIVRVGRVESMYGNCWRVAGKGTGGTVKLFQKNDGKTFAVKEFRAINSKESLKHYAACLAKEYCIGAILDHDHIIRTLELVVEDGKFYEVMEYCDTDLFTVIKEGTCDRIALKRYFTQIVEGVDYLHDLGIAHRDLKPENVCISGGNAKIIDFGLCSVFKLGHSGRKKMSHGLCGSAPYIAPEEWMGKDYDPTKVDVWSLGIVLVAILCKSFPWELASTKDPNYCMYLRYQKSGSVFPLFRCLEKDALSLLGQMLHSDPKKRATVKQVLQSPWLSK
ncbi:hypothetical protein MP638_002802 [Amoeboaphelidium occidentale]|nr:hypothetical protein MP638_002802 [Amoeboaphelidium occidentale]